MKNKTASIQQDTIGPARRERMEAEAQIKAMAESIEWANVITVDKDKFGVGFKDEQLVMAKLRMNGHHEVEPCTVQEAASFMRRLLTTETLTWCDSESDGPGYDRFLAMVAALPTAEAPAASVEFKAA